MLVYRSFALGLLGACCLLLATRPQGSVILNPVVVVPTDDAVSSTSCRPALCASPMGPPVTVVDVAPNVTGAMLAQLIVLAGNERIARIDDAPVADARVALASLELAGRRYVDIAVENDAGSERRVLVLVP